MLAVKTHLRPFSHHGVAAMLYTVESFSGSSVATLRVRFPVLVAAQRCGSQRDEKRTEARGAGAAHSGEPHEARHRASDSALPAPAIEVLLEARALNDGSGLVFPSSKQEGKEVSDMILTNLLRLTRLVGRAIVDGFRSALTTQVSEQATVAHPMM